MVIVIIRFVQLPSVIQRHLFFGRVTHIQCFAIPLVHFIVAQLNSQRLDHSAIQADEAVLTRPHLDSIPVEYL